MPQSTKVVALLVANPALSSILSMVIASVPTLRVRPFESLLSLSTYMQLAPVDLVVSDFDSESAPADMVARDLRHDGRIERRNFQMIALATRVTAETKLASVRAGIDEIIVKPMSPKYLLERVQSRLQRRAATARLTPRPPVQYGGNVIPLFGDHRPVPQH